MKKIFAILLLTAVACFGGYEEQIVETWGNRPFFSAEITRLDITPFDTLTESGKFILNNPNFYFETGAELIVFAEDTLYTFTTGSDVGIKTPIEEFIYADVGIMISRLREDFTLGYIPRDTGVSVIGKDGTSNVDHFDALLDEDFLPQRITWVDVFDNEVVLIFEKVAAKDTGEKIRPPEGIEFILE
ncbi:MAG TPA: hypothetical protein ENN75_03440 [candidate division Zixibacteria bacterium]|nr:hypothetical protein [candidate division Zixibacteria bacterium]